MLMTGMVVEQFAPHTGQVKLQLIILSTLSTICWSCSFWWKGNRYIDRFDERFVRKTSRRSKRLWRVPSCQRQMLSRILAAGQGCQRNFRRCSAPSRRNSCCLDTKTDVRRTVEKCRNRDHIIRSQLLP
jgi:hypothetical protein